MLKNSLKISSQGYPVYIKLVDFLVINFTLIFSAKLLGMLPFSTIVILSVIFSLLFLLFAEYTKMYQQKIKTISLRNQRDCWRVRYWPFSVMSGFVRPLRILSRWGIWMHWIRLLFSYCHLVFYSTTCPLFYSFFLFKYSAKKHIRVAVIGLTENGLAAENALTTEYANIKLDPAFYDERSPDRCGDVVDKIKAPFAARSLI